MSRLLRLSTAQTERIGPYLDATDGVTEETALTPATELSKDGAAFAAGPTGTHDAEGWYSVALTTTHTNTLGSLVIKSQASATHLPVWHEFMVLPAVVYDALVLGTDELNVNVAQWLGTAAATPTVAGVPEVDLTRWAGVLANALVAGRVDADVGNMQANTVNAAAIAAAAITAAKFAAGAIDAAALATDAVNEIAAAIGPKKNQAFSDLGFLMVLSSDGQTPATGLTVTGQRSIDGAAFGAVSGTIAEVGNGIYQFDALAADMNADVVVFRFSSATALDTFITIKTTP